MLAKDTRERQEKLNGLIREMATKMYSDEKDDDAIHALAILKQVYLKEDGKHSGFRHNYSVFFPLILDLYKEGCDLGYLNANLQSLMNFLELDYTTGENQYERLFHYSRKLCDHLNLEIARLDYYSKNEAAILDAKQDVKLIETQTKQAAQNIGNLESQINTATTTLKSAAKKAQSLQTQMITILSIFAAVIIAFFGGINFISSAISSINGVHVYKSAVIVLIAGFILFNCIFLLMYVIARMVDKSIYAPCKTEWCECKNKCPLIIRAGKRMPYVLWTNISLILLLLIVCAIWYYVGAPI